MGRAQKASPFRPDAARAQAAQRRALSGSAKNAGFTLVELMATIAVIGLVGVVAVLSLPDPTPDVSDEAEQLGARLVQAREEALLTNRPIAVRLDASGYGFQRLAQGQWAPLNDGPLQAEAWAEGTSARVDPETALIVFDPTGMADAATVRLSRADSAANVIVDSAGEVRVDG